MNWDARLDVLAAALQAVNVDRIVTRDFLPMDRRNDDDLEKGVFTIISKTISGLYRPMGSAEDAARQGLLIVGQCRVPNGAEGEGTGSEVEALEFTLIGELETMVNGSLPEAIGGLEWQRVSQSGQLSAPHGWIAAEFEIGP